MARQTRSAARATATSIPAKTSTKRTRQHESLSKATASARNSKKIQTGNKGVEVGGHKSSTSEQTRTLAHKKFESWQRFADTSPFSDFTRPTPEECGAAHRILNEMHGETVQKNFGEDAADGPLQDGNYTCVMDALVVAAVSQATSWANAKRAMNSMNQVYGSTFAYDAIIDGGIDKLTDALRPGGMQNRKSKILMGLLKDVKSRHGSWDLQHLFEASDEEVMKEVVSYWGLGPKCAHCLMSICLKRDRFAVDTHIYRLSGIWGWRPREASVEKTQAHLDSRIPHSIKFLLHYEMIVHGRQCPSCRGQGNTNKGAECELQSRLSDMREEGSKIAET